MVTVFGSGALPGMMRAVAAVVTVQRVRKDLSMVTVQQFSIDEEGRWNLMWRKIDDNIAKTATSL